MRRGTLTLLAVLTVVAAVGAWLAMGGEQAAGPTEAGQALYPELDARVNDVREIRVTGPKGVFHVRHESDGWKVVEKSGYPALADTVKKAIMGASRLRIDSAKTDQPAQYAKLGVQEPSPGAPAEEEEENKALLLELRGEGIAPLAAFIVGNRKAGTQPQLYVRRQGEARSWLVDGELVVDPDPGAWVERQITELPADRVKDVTIQHADGETVVVSRADASATTWDIQGVPEGQEPKSAAMGRSVAAPLEWLSLDEVQRVDELAWPSEGTASSTFRTFDGLVLVAHTAPVEEKFWVRFQASAAEDATDAVKDEVLALTGKLGPWVYAIPQHKADVLRRRMADLVKDKEPPPPELPPEVDVPLELPPEIVPDEAASPGDG